MKGTLIFFGVVGLVVALFVFKPWAPKRYDDSPAGQRIEKIDEHVDFWLDWRPPQTWEALDFITTGPTERNAVSSRSYWGGYVPGYGDDKTFAKEFVDALYAAGAPKVQYLSVKQGGGLHPEGLYAELPADKPTRKRIFAIASRGYQALGEQLPKDLNQKYLYFGFGSWKPEDKEPGWMPEGTL